MFDEDFWLNAVPPIIATLYQKLPNWDPEEISILLSSGTPSPPIVSPFFLQSITQLNPTILQLKYTIIPLLSNPFGINDALNPNNYSLIGPAANTIISVVPVASDPQSVFLTVTQPLINGFWVITASNVKDVKGDLLGIPNSLQFTITNIVSSSIPNAGTFVLNDAPSNIIRKHFNQSLSGRGWDALIAGLSAGDNYLFNTGRQAFNQMFKSSATGKYLDRKASDDGFVRPSGVGISDDTFRKLAINIGSQKLTLQSFLQTLEIYYGADALRASIDSISAEPYIINDLDDLIINVDGKTITVLFNIIDFANNLVATATEIAAKITRSLQLKGLNAYAKPILNVTTQQKIIRIYSGALGIKGTVSINGGKAQNTLQCPTSLATTQIIGTQWTIDTPASLSTLIPNRVRFTTVSNINLTLVRIGDYVTLYGTQINPVNQGTFSIANVTSNFFEVVNSVGVSQSITQVTVTDVAFYRPTSFTVNNKSRLSIAAQSDTLSTNIILPATTQAVSRTANSGAYLNINPLVTIAPVVTASGGLGPQILLSGGMLIGNEWAGLVEYNTTRPWVNTFKASRALQNVTGARFAKLGANGWPIEDWNTIWMIAADPTADYGLLLIYARVPTSAVLAVQGGGAPGLGPTVNWESTINNNDGTSTYIGHVWFHSSNANNPNPGTYVFWLDQTPTPNYITLTGTGTGGMASVASDFLICQPGYDVPGGPTPNPKPFRQLSTDRTKSQNAQFKSLRLMGSYGGNYFSDTNWASRTPPDWPVGGSNSTKYPPFTNIFRDEAASFSSGISLENVIRICNEQQLDSWVNVPVGADDDYVTKMSQVYAFGSTLDGTPYTQPQVNPAHPPLLGTQKVYVEYSNELWNPMFPQGGVLAAMALFDLYQGLRSDGTSWPVNYPHPLPANVENINYDNQLTPFTGTGAVVIASAPTGLTESGFVVTVITSSVHGLVAGNNFFIGGAGVVAYNGNWTVLNIIDSTHFTFTHTTSGLANSGGGTVSRPSYNAWWNPDTVTVADHIPVIISASVINSTGSNLPGGTGQQYRVKATLTGDNSESLATVETGLLGPVLANQAILIRVANFNPARTYFISRAWTFYITPGTAGTSNTERFMNQDTAPTTGTDDTYVIGGGSAAPAQGKAIAWADPTANSLPPTWGLSGFSILTMSGVAGNLPDLSNINKNAFAALIMKGWSQNTAQPWQTGTPYSINDLVAAEFIINGNQQRPKRLYRATSAGNAGATAPTGITTSNDGVVNWQYVQDLVFVNNCAGSVSFSTIDNTGQIVDVDNTNKILYIRSATTPGCYTVWVGLQPGVSTNATGAINTIFLGGFYQTNPLANTSWIQRFNARRAKRHRDRFAATMGANRVRPTVGTRVTDSPGTAHVHSLYFQQGLVNGWWTNDLVPPQKISDLIYSYAAAPYASGCTPDGLFGFWAVPSLTLTSHSDDFQAAKTAVTRTAAIAVPAGLAVGAAAGSLPNATYSYRLAARNEVTKTAASSAVTRTGSGGNALTWTLVTGATQIRVYGRSSGTEKFLIELAGNATSWTDDGSLTPSTATEDMVTAALPKVTVVGAQTGFFWAVNDDAPIISRGYCFTSGASARRYRDTVLNIDVVEVTCTSPPFFSQYEVVGLPVGGPGFPGGKKQIIDLLSASGGSFGAGLPTVNVFRYAESGPYMTSVTALQYGTLGVLQYDDLPPGSPRQGRGGRLTSDWQFDWAGGDEFNSITANDIPFAKIFMQSTTPGSGAVYEVQPAFKGAQGNFIRMAYSQQVSASVVTTGNTNQPPSATNIITITVNFLAGSTNTTVTGQVAGDATATIYVLTVAVPGASDPVVPIAATNLSGGSDS